MPLPSSINDLSQTAGSNSPSGSEAPSLIDDYLRTYASYIAQHRDGKGFALEASVASAATCDIGAANSLIVQITGTTGITSFGTTYSGPRIVRFAAALTLTHSATLVLPGAANITTAAGDFLIAVPNGNPASGWRVTSLPASGVVSKSGDVMTGGLTVPSLNGGQLAGTRNKIINGKMEIAQRGTSFASPATASYLADRWRIDYVSSAAGTVTQNSDIPSGLEFQNSLRYTVTTADSSIAASDFSAVQQFIEGFNIRDLIGRTFTLGFWVRSSKTGVHCVAFRNSASDRSYVSEYTISAANTWEFKSITVPGGLITAGTWNYTNGIGLQVSFILAAGTSSQTTAGAWQSGNFLATAGQVNCLDTIGNIFAITGVQLEVGAVATPFEHRQFQQELAFCQRYYQVLTMQLAGYTSAGTSNSYFTQLPVQMRVTATAVSTPITNTNVTGSAVIAVAQGTASLSSVGSALGGFVSSASATLSSEL